jgi:formylglycine-generating enzyme required for sulfatase activity
MGSPGAGQRRHAEETPRHEVRIAYDLAVGCYPITFEDFDRFAETGGVDPSRDEGWGRGRRPAINVSWDDAQAYVAWLGKETGQSYRLLSEAEWEYGCRAGTTTRYWWGDDPPTPERAAFDMDRSTEVGSYPPNPWGLCDMHGNVWDWVEDCWNESYAGAPDDGRAWTSGDCSRRVMRGGSWGDRPEGLCS